jgi:hypothetical protein
MTISETISDYYMCKSVIVIISVAFTKSLGTTGKIIKNKVLRKVWAKMIPILLYATCVFKPFDSLL